MVINKFDGEHSFLSNFFECDITFEGKHYPSVEHAFQAAKTLNETERSIVCAAATPGKAKRLGQGVMLRNNWDAIKDDVMFELLERKFILIENLKEKLILTGDAKLIEGNNWNDTYWGICNGIGQNKLGKLLMKVRDKINTNKVQLLVSIADNLADEMNVKGFIIINAQEWNIRNKIVEERFKEYSAEHPVIIHIGTNETVKYESYKDFSSHLTIIAITNEEENFLRKSFKLNCDCYDFGNIISNVIEDI